MENRVLVTTLLSSVLIWSFGCDNRQVRSDNKQDQTRGGTAAAMSTSAEQAPDHPLGQPTDYFPTDIGHRWSYKITLADSESALNHKVVSWPMGEKGSVQSETRGRYLPDRKGPKSFYRLTISVKKQASKQGHLSYPEGYELSIDEDELGIFESTIGVFLAVTRNPRYSADLVTTYDPTSSSAPHSGSLWGSSYNRPGHGMRVYFFGEKPGMQIGISKQNDAVMFDGPVKFKGKAALKFTRKVKPNEKSDTDRETSVLDKGFEEEMFFVRSVGLAHLVQRVDGQVTMTWELE